MKTKARITLDQIRIASPCPASWENMIGDDRVRFCDTCSKKVYNLSTMTRVEAEILLNEKKGTLCGLIYVRRDGSVMTKDCPVGLRAIRKRIAKRWTAIAGILLTLFGVERVVTNHSENDMGTMAISSEDLNPSLDEMKEEHLEALGYISE